MSVLNEGVPVPVAQLNPVSGLPVTFGALPAVIVFVRDLHGTTARMALAALTSIWSELDARAIQLAVVTHTDLTYARDYVPRHHVLFPLVVDETGELREKFGLGSDSAFTGTLLSLRPRNVKAWVDGLGLSRDLVMPNTELGGEFVIDRNGRVVYARAFKGVLDQPDIAKLKEAVL